MKWTRFFCYALMIFFHQIGWAENIVIGLDQINPPMATKTDAASHFIGFEVDMMNEICSRLKLTCSYKAVIANQIITELESEKIDLAMDSIVIPNFQLFGLIFSLPYLPSNGQFMTLKTSKIHHMSEIANKTIGVRLGAFQANLEYDMYVKALFKTKLKVKGYTTMPELLSALNDHEVDVVFANKITENYWYNENDNMYRYLGSSMPLGNGYGILATAKHAPLMQAINTTIQKIMNDGTYDMIYQRYVSNFQ